MPAPTDISLTHNEIELLRAALDDWATKSRLEKQEAKAALVLTIVRGRGIDDNNQYAYEFIRTKVTHWFSNNAPTKDSRLPRSLRTVWTAREVFYIVREKDIMERVSEIIEEQGKVFIAALNTARSQMWGELAPAEKTGFEKQADEWTEDGADPELQSLIADRRLADWVESFIVLLYTQAGAVSELTFYYRDKLSKLNWGRYDISMQWNSVKPECPKFTAAFPNWKTDYYNLFARFAELSLFPERHDLRKEPGLNLKELKPRYEFKLFPDGTPILPPMDDFRRQVEKENIMRAFVSIHWSLACGIKNASVAWAAIAAHPELYFREGLFSGDITVKEPTRMNVVPMCQWWERVLELQEEDDPALRFRFTHWWDGSSRHTAKYNGTVSKNAEKEQHEKRVRCAVAPPKGAWDLQAVLDLAPEGSAGSATSSDSDDGTAALPAPKKKSGRPAPRPQKKTVVAAKAQEVEQGKGKGKAKATGQRKRARRAASLASEKEPEAVSSDESEGEASPDLGSEEDSPGEEEIDINVSGEEDGAPPLLALKRHSRLRAKKPAAGGSPLVTNSPSSGDIPQLAQSPVDIAVPPDAGLVAKAQAKPPAWVGPKPERVFAFLWALSTEPDYQAVLKSWVHMFRRRSTFKDVGPGRWASWDSSDFGLPPAVHSDSKQWQGVMTWLNTHTLSQSSSMSEAQQWALAMGLALRDAHIANSCEEGEPVPYGGPAHLAGSEAKFSHIVENLLPACVKSVYPATTGMGAGTDVGVGTGTSTSMSMGAGASTGMSTGAGMGMGMGTGMVVGIVPVPRISTPSSSTSSAAEVEREMAVTSTDPDCETALAVQPPSISGGLAAQAVKGRARGGRKQGAIANIPSGAVARQTRSHGKQQKVQELGKRKGEHSANEDTESLPPPKVRRTNRTTAGKRKV